MANQGWGTSTAGTEFIGEVRNLETTDIVSPTRERIGSTDAPELRGSIFGQQEVSLSRRWKADLGLRYAGPGCMEGPCRRVRRCFSASLPPRFGNSVGTRISQPSTVGVLDR